MTDQTGQSTSRDGLPQELLDKALSDKEEERLEAVKLLSAYYKKKDAVLRDEAKEELKRLCDYDKLFVVRKAAREALKWVPPIHKEPRQPHPWKKVLLILASVIIVLLVIDLTRTLDIIPGIPSDPEPISLPYTDLSLYCGNWSTHPFGGVRIDVSVHGECEVNDLELKYRLESASNRLESVSIYTDWYILDRTTHSWINHRVIGSNELPDGYSDSRHANMNRVSLLLIVEATAHTNLGTYVEIDTMNVIDDGRDILP